MKPALLQTFIKDGLKLDEAFRAASQCWVEGLGVSYVCFSPVSSLGSGVGLLTAHASLMQLGSA